MIKLTEDAASTLPVSGLWITTLSDPNPTDPGYMDTEADNAHGVRQVLIAELLAPSIVSALAKLCPVRHDPSLVNDRDALLKAVSRAQALIVGPRLRLDAELLRAAKKLRFVGHTALHQDPAAAVLCEQRGVTLITAAGAHAQAVAEYVISMTLTLRRGVCNRTQQVAAGLWPQAGLARGREVFGATLGIVGFGLIGQTVAKLAQGLGMRVVAHDPAIPMDEPVWQRRAVRPMFMDELLKCADIVSLHVPLTPQTRGMMDAAALTTMKRGAVLINAAQGGLVDDEALVLALQGGQLSGAALDVYAHEPLPAAPSLADCPNLILTPHIAGLTQESAERAARMVAERVALALGVG